MLKALEPIPCVPLQGPQNTFGWWVLTGEFPREKRAGGLCRTVARITCQTAVPFRASTQWTARVLKKSDVVQQSISLSLSSKTVQPTTLLCPDSRQMVSQGRQLRISGSSEGSAPQSTRRVRAAPASPGRAHKTSSQNHPPKKIIKVKHKNTYPGHVKTNAFRCPPCRPHPSPSRSPKQCWPWRVPCGSSSWAERIG